MTALALPVRSKRALAGGDTAHEGWRSDADWQGMLPGDLLPQVVNPPQGWIVSANHRPIASFYPVSLGISTGSLGDTDRSWRLKERLAARKPFAPQDVLAIQYDTVSSVKRDLVRLGYHLRDTLKAPLEEETRLALRYLESWRDHGSRLEMSIPGTEILNLMPLAFRQNFAAARIYGGGLSGLCHMLKTIDARLAEDPRAPLREEEAEYVDLILRAAWRYGKASFGEDPSRWNERGREQLRETRLGYMETLDGFPSLDPSQDVTLPDLKCVDGGTILSERAQSYTQFVPLHDADEALALLPIGESEHPGSPSRLSGYALWAKGELRPAPLSRAKVERYVVSRELLGQERTRSRGRRPDISCGRRRSASHSGRRSGWPTARTGSTQEHGLRYRVAEQRMENEHETDGGSETLLRGERFPGGGERGPHRARRRYAAAHRGAVRAVGQ
jgi:penicillin G amidase